MTAASTASKMLARVGIFLAVAPMIGPSNQGTLVATSAWSAVVALIVAYGFQVKVLRVIPAEPHHARGVLKTDLAAMSWLCVPAALAFALAAAFVIPRHDWPVFVVVFAATLCSVVIDYISCALRALDSFAREAKISVFSSLLQFALVVGAGFVTGSLFTIVIALLVSRAIAAIVSLASVFRHDTVRQSVDASGDAFQTIRSSWAYFMDATLSVGLSQIDILVLNFMTDRATVGIYAAGSRLIQLMMVVPWMVTNLVVPALASARDAKSRAFELRRLARGMFGLAFVGALSILLFGPLFVNLLLGAEFAALNFLWPAFAAMLLARFYESYFGIILTSLGRMGTRVAAQGGGLIAIAVLSVVLVPALGTKGLILTLSIVSLAAGLLYSHTPGIETNPNRLKNILIATGILAGVTMATLF